MMEVVIAPQREEDRKKFVNSFKENKKGYNIYKQTTGNRKFWALHENLSYSKENSQISVYFPELALNEDGEVLVVSTRKYTQKEDHKITGESTDLFSGVVFFMEKFLEKHYPINRNQVE